MTDTTMSKDRARWPGVVYIHTSRTYRPARRNPDGSIIAFIGGSVLPVQSIWIRNTYTEAAHQVAKAVW